MTAEQQFTKPNCAGTPNPPSFAKNLLSFFLPAALREPILGDLEEEFAYRLYSNNRFIDVNRWYWWQALKSSCLFFWQQRGTTMAYLVSVIIFSLLIGLAVVTSTYSSWLVSPPILIFILPISLVLGIGATSFQAAKVALKLSFSDSNEYSPQTVSLAHRFLHVTGNQFLFVAGISFFLGIANVFIIFSQNPELLDDPVHYIRYGVGVLSLFYGLIFKCLFYSAEQKLLWKYLSDRELSVIR